MTEHKEVEPAKLATPDATLLAELMNPNLAKYEREHAAVRHIEYLNQVIDSLREPNTIALPTAEYEQLKADAEKWRNRLNKPVIQDGLRITLEYKKRDVMLNNIATLPLVQLDQSRHLYSDIANVAKSLWEAIDQARSKDETEYQNIRTAIYGGV